MYIDFLIKEWWLSIIIGDLLILSDFWLTITGAKLHKNFVAKYIYYEKGYELNPNFENEIAQNRWISRKLIVNMLFLSIYLAFLGFLSEKILPIQTIFEFLIGGLLLSRIDLVLLHLQNIWFFTDVKRSGGLVGYLENSYWISQRKSAARVFSQTILFALIAFVIMRPFFWGGVVSCGLIGVLNLKWANR
jgi:hypothetical protein